MSATAERPVTRDDLERKLRELKGEVSETAQSATTTLVAVGAAAVMGVVAVAYLLGRRRGRIRSTVVEVRRI